MELFDNILYLSFFDLINYGVPENTLKSGCLRHRKEGFTAWEHIKVPKLGVLIKYESIPAATVEKFNIPDKQTLLRIKSLQKIKDLVRVNFKDKEFYLNNPATHSLAHEYSKISAWLTFCASQKTKDARGFGFIGIDELYEVAMQLMQEEGFKTWKVGNLRVFKRRLQPFNNALKNEISREEALETLICKKVGNDNAAKLGTDQKALLVQLYSDDSKPNFEQVHTFYTRTAIRKIEEGEWTEKALVEVQTIQNYLNRPDVMQLWFLPRHGKKEYKNEFEPTIRRIAPSFANALWVMDGSPWHMYYRDGKNAYARLNIFPILDAYSWAVIGFSIDYNETSRQVITALHGACLRSGVLPYQLQYDNSSAIKSYQVQKCIKKISKYDTATKVGNARAKVIEPFFKHFNDRILKFLPNYAGSNITATKLDSHINRERLQSLLKEGNIPTLEQAIQQMEYAFRLWNKHPFKGSKGPLDRYIESFEATRDKQRYFSHMMQVDAFWEMPGEMKKVKFEEDGKIHTKQIFEPKPYTFSMNGIQVERKDPGTGEVKFFEFDVENASFRAKNINRAFNIKYDPAKMDKVYLYLNDKPVCDDAGNFVAAYDKTAIHMALADRTKGEGHELHRLESLKKQQIEIVLNEHTAIVQTTKMNGSFTPVNHDNLYPKEVMNAVKASMMESGFNAELPAGKKELKRKGNSKRFDSEDQGQIEVPEIKPEQEVKPKSLNRWE